MMLFVCSQCTRETILIYSCNIIIIKYNEQLNLVKYGPS